MGIKIDPADKAFSECVRERAGWQCEGCSRQFSNEERGSLQCCHIYGRRHKSIRQEPLNAVAMCFKCHGHYTENPLEFAEFIGGQLTATMIDILLEKRQGIVKYNALFKKDCAAHYRSEFKTMRDRRLNGAVGRLEFTGFL